ncbi:hypothetical protein [Saccharopolyspora rhizosphaerae]|nr:hypothetical protein [Saccharopolyspora rhizosphaerae]
MTATAAHPVAAVSGLTQRHGRRTVLRGVDLEVQATSPRAALGST